MRNKLGLVQIKVRAKDSSTIDLSGFDIDDLEIIGDIEDAKGGKLIALDVFISDANDDYISYYGVTLLNNYDGIEVICVDTLAQAIQKFILTKD